MSIGNIIATSALVAALVAFAVSLHSEPVPDDKKFAAAYACGWADAQVRIFNSLPEVFSHQEEDTIEVCRTLKAMAAKHGFIPSK